MSPIAIAFLLFILLTIIAWLVLENTASAPWRIAAGLFAIVLVSFSVWAVTGVILRFNYNAYYGSATDELLEGSLAALERDDVETVRKVFRGLRDQYQPTYENKAGYARLVEEAARHLRGERPITPGSKWDGSPFTRAMWEGFWEQDGFWLVINGTGESLSVLRSGDPPMKLSEVVLSADRSTLTFEGDSWRYTLTLTRPDEGTLEWFDLKRNTVWRTTPIYKLVRAR